MKTEYAMRFLYSLGLLSLFIGIVLCPSTSQATHVRAGEITTKRISTTSLTYKVTFTAYYDEGLGKMAADQANSYTFCFGDGTTADVKRNSRILINGNTSSVNSYTTIHTYPGPGPYTISVTVLNRNQGTNNLPPANQSQSIPFFVSTTILINAALLTNSTPVMLNPPLDSGRVGQKFCHNPAAYDADGDSLAYRLSIPKTSVDAAGCNGRNIPVYQDPTRFSTSSESGGPASFSINATNGDLCWDAPGTPGQYNFAFIIEEWRNGVLIGEITRDMQIVVLDSKNLRPLIQPIADLCVEAGSLVTQPVTATDPDGQRVILTGYGGVFNVGADNKPLAAGELIPPAYARLTNGGVPLPSPATATFSWQTNCNQIRQQPYEVVFKATDVPPKPASALVSFQSFAIRVIGPAIKNLTATPTAGPSGSRAVRLTWDAYSCGAAGTTLNIYRKQGCQDAPLPACTTGPPPGYQLIATLPLSATTYLDSTQLSRGASYAYRVAAQFPDANGGLNGGLSLASQQACLAIPSLAPILTQVSVDSTQDVRGQISLRWTRPLGLKAGDLPGPYQYRLLRAAGLNGTAFSPIATIPTTLLASAADTLYIDKGSSASALATSTTAYRYQVEFYYTNASGQLTRLDAADAASSVLLSVRAASRQLVLTWQTNTPWSNDNQTHDVYRSRSGPQGPFNRIAQVRVSSPPYSFTDTGGDTYAQDGNTAGPLSADSSYCYRVMTAGQYVDPQLARFTVGPNYSQIACASPADTSRPCPPTLQVDSLNCARLGPEALCDQTSFTNTLHWQPSTGAGCDPNLSGYKIYYGRYQTDTLNALSSVSVPTTSFAHSSLSTVAGCYYVTAVSRRGLESAPSNKVCVEACPAFVLPNVFTPNGDGKNDVFEPLRCPQFVASVELVVYNRWGAQLYAGVGPVLAWDGRSSDGTGLPSGLYYYQVTVHYALLSRDAPPQVLKGWVQLFRDNGSIH